MNILEKVLPLLADQTRLRILRHLLEQDFCVGALARKLAISEPAVSQHLKKLRQCGLVTGEKRGYWVHYSVNTALVTEAADELRTLAELKRSDAEACCKRSHDGGCCCNVRKSDNNLQDLNVKMRKERYDEPQ